MNPFRIIILVLLSVSLLMMLYIVAVVVPNRQTEYAQYQSTLQMMRFNERNQAHQARMDQIAPRAESDSMQTAIDEVKEAQLQREAELAEAEERNVIALARAKEEQAAAEAKAAEEKAKSTSAGFEIIGQIASYDPEWASILLNPAEGAIITNGLRIAITREEGIICEAMIDGKDEPSGQYIASMLPGKIGNSEPKAPAAGDKVIVSPFESSQDIRNGSNTADTAPTNYSNYDSGAQKASEGLQDIDATLVPIP